MNLYDLSQKGNLPVYEYLYKCIRDDILSGELEAGSKLMSKRALASLYDIAIITVENAYAQLLLEGYIYSRERSGYYVSDIVPFVSSTDSYSPSLSVNGADNLFHESSAKSSENTTPVIDLSQGSIKREAFPFASWAKLSRRILLDEEQNLLVAPHPQGVYKLRCAIARLLGQTKGLNVNPDNIIVGPGSEYLHQILIQLIGKSRIVAAEDPGYKKVGSIFESNGVKCIYIPVDDKGLNVKKLYDHNIKLVHTSPSHHFPTGCTMPIDRRMELISWASSNDTYIIEDDYDSEFRLSGRPIPTLVSLNADRVVYMNTFTKSMAPSIRIAYAVLPDALMDIYRKKLSFYSGAVSSFDQYTLAAFIDEGYFERHISRMRNYYKKLRDDIISIFNSSELNKVATLKEEHAGLHFILRINLNIDDNQFINRLREKSIALKALSDYCYHKTNRYDHCFIINYGNADKESFRMAVSTILATLKGM